MSEYSGREIKINMKLTCVKDFGPVRATIEYLGDDLENISDEHLDQLKKPLALTRTALRIAILRAIISGKYLEPETYLSITVDK